MTATAQAESPILEMELEPRTAHLPAPTTINANVLTPMQLLHVAVQRGADMDQLERLYALHQRFLADEARNAFVAAMAEFKLNAPEIYKTRHVGFESRKEGASRTEYNYAGHFEVTMPIIRGLAKHGFSHDWDIEQKDGQVHVTCVVTHRLGHSKSVHMFCAPDTSGNKNGVQSIGSAKTFLERYTLLAATGLSTGDMPHDDDGRGTDAGQVGGAGYAANDPPFDTKAPPPTYPQERFDRNLPEWKRLISSGEKSVDRLIAFIESRGMPLAEEQRKTLMGIANPTS